MNPLTYTRAAQLFTYDKRAGTLRWRARPASDFSRPQAHKMWSTRFAHQLAGSTTGTGYRQVSVDAQGYLQHQLVWLLAYHQWPPRRIRHINGDKTDNRIGNLRLVPPPRQPTGTTGVTADRGRFRARASTHGIASNHTSYATGTEAADALGAR